MPLAREAPADRGADAADAARDQHDPAGAHGIFPVMVASEKKPQGLPGV
jgi:hypothetical protein